MKLKHLLVAICSMATMSMVSCNSTVDYSTVPTPVKQFVDQHFAGQKVQSVKADTDDAIPEYDIYLENGTKVEINKEGVWKEISNVSASVPLTMLPDSAQAYIAAKYPNSKVIKVEKEKTGYEVKLSNGTELEFNADGAFIKID